MPNESACGTVPTMRFASLLALPLVVLTLSGCVHEPSFGLPTQQSLNRDPSMKVSGLGLGKLRFDASQEQFPSGLRLGHERTTTKGMVGIVVTVGSGSTKDPIGKEGLAHFVEHLVFRSRHDQGRSLDVRLKLAGATGINASTSPDATAFYGFVPASGFPKLVKEMGLMLSRPIDAIADADAGTEREVIKNELRQRDETGVVGQMRAWIAEALMPAEHPYRRSIGGSIDTVGKLDVNAATEFAKLHYKPNNVSIMVVGEAPFSDIEEIVKKELPQAWIGDVSTPADPMLSETPPLAQILPEVPKEGALTHYAAVDAPTLVISWRIPSTYSEAGHISQIVTAPAALEELRTAATNITAVQKASAWASAYLQSTVISCAVELSDPLAWQDVAEVLKKFYTERFSPYNQRDWMAVAVRDGYIQANSSAANYSQYLASLRQRTTAEFLFSSESYTKRIHHLAGFLHFENNLNAFSGHLEQIGKTSYRELASIIPSYLSESQARLVYIHSKPSVEAVTIFGTGVLRNNVLDQVAEKPGEGALLSEPPRARRDEAYLTTKETILPNGLRVVALRKNGYPTITAALAFRTGWASSTPRAAEAFVRSIESYQPATRSDAGLKVEAITTADVSANIVVAGRSNMPQALALLAQSMVETDNNYSWNEVADNLHRKHVKTSPLEPSELLGKDLSLALYPKSSLSSYPSTNEIRSLSGSQISKWLARSRHPSNAVLVVAGDGDPDVALQWATRIFGKWEGVQADKVSTPTIETPIPEPSKRRVFVRAAATERPQVEITLACRLPKATEQDEATFDELEGVMSGWLSTRLREEAGLSYGVSGGVRIYRGGGSHLAISLSADRKQLTKALKIIVGHWDAFGSSGFDQGSMSQIRWNLATAMNLGQTTSTDLAMDVATAAVNGFALDHSERYREDLGNVTQSDLRRAFATCSNSTVIGLLGDIQAIDRSLAALNIEKSVAP
jgi:zinc protease